MSFQNFGYTGPTPEQFTDAAVDIPEFAPGWEPDTRGIGDRFRSIRWRAIDAYHDWLYANDRNRYSVRVLQAAAALGFIGLNVIANHDSLGRFDDRILVSDRLQQVETGSPMLDAVPEGAGMLVDNYTTHVFTPVLDKYGDLLEWAGIVEPLEPNPFDTMN